MGGDHALRLAAADLLDLPERGLDPPVEGPDVTLIPWVNIILLVLPS
jgi:hypothetical protein